MDLFSFLVLVVVAVFGAAFGSFLSVCIYRIPFERGAGYSEEEEAAIKKEEEEMGIGHLPDLPKPYEIGGKKLSFLWPPRSFCPHCKNQLLWWHNIPVLSWLILGGACYFCKAKISVRYPSVELLSAIFALFSVMSFGLTATALVVYLFCAALLVLSFIDIDYFILPNTITYPGVILGILLAVLNGWCGWLHKPLAANGIESLLGILGGAGFLWALSTAYLRLRGKMGMGLGDVKLLAMSGAFFGISGAYFTLFLGSIVGSVLGLTLIAVGGKKFSHHLPFGPYLALGNIVYLFAYPQMQSGAFGSLAEVITNW